MAEKTDIIEESKSVDDDELIKKIEAIDESVLPDKEEILKKLRANAGKKVESAKKTDNVNTKSKGNSILLPIGMFFQFIFTVAGGGMFISGLIAGFSVGWDTSQGDGTANISIFLSIVGGIMFAIGIALAFILYKAALKRYIAGKMK